MKNGRAKNILLDLIYDIIGSIFYGISIYTFAKIGNFAPARNERSGPDYELPVASADWSDHAGTEPAADLTEL